MRRVDLAPPVLGRAESEALCRVIDDNWLAMGERVRQLEESFASLHGIAHGVALNSCTAALHLALEAFGIGQDHEVLVPSLSFAATANGVIYAGATPVFVDIEAVDIPHISLEKARQALTPRTKAVIVMHYGGYLMDMEPWRAFADEHKLILIEDAAHTAGLQGSGVHSDGSAFSFYSNKNMTTGEGGMLLVHDEEADKRLRLMRSHGMTSTTLDRDKGHAYGYDVVDLGYNYRMDELRAAVGLAQLETLAERNARRVELSVRYRKVFNGEVTIPFNINWAQCGHIMPVLLPDGRDRAAVMAHLRENGVQSSIHYRPIHTFSYHRNRFPDLPDLSVTETYGERVLTLPLHPAMADDDVDYVVATLKTALNG